MNMISKKSEEVLKNSHTTLKWVWIIIMGLALIKSIETFLFCIEPATGAQILRDWKHVYPKDVLIFVAFIITIVRFHHGDSRYLDKTYLEDWLQKNNSNRYSSGFRFFEFYILLFHAIVLYALAVSQRNFLYFFSTYLVLLILNIFWLSIVCARTKVKEERRHPLNWVINNSIHAILIIILYFATHQLEVSYSYIVFFILVLSNTFFDYLTTWKYYFPKITDTETAENTNVTERETTEG